MSISLVAGLGNPGRDYELSRHNLGWLVVDAYASKHGLSWKAAPQFDSLIARRDLGPGRTVWFMKPHTFMNESGRAVAALARYHKIPTESVAAVYDDLTIDLGLVKVSEATPATTASRVCWSTWETALRGFALASAPGSRPKWTSRTSCSHASHKINRN